MPANDHDDLFVLAPSRIHGLGVFALQDLKRGQVLARYQGTPIASLPPAPGPYVFHNRSTGRFVDAADDRGNVLTQIGKDKQGRPLYQYVRPRRSDPRSPTVAKFMNHLPSAWSNCRITSGGKVVTKRCIRKGEELTYSYGPRCGFGYRDAGPPLDLSSFVVPPRGS